MAAAELPLPPALRSIVDQFAAHVDAPVLCIPRSESAPKALLSIDGGGLRGIIPAVVLCYIEQAIKHVVLEQRARWPVLVPESVKNAKDFHIELADYFDLFAGNSAGSFLSTFLATRGAETSSGLPLLKALGVRPGSAASLAVFWIHAAMVFSKIGPIDWTNNEAYKESRKMSSDVFDKFVVDVLGERPLSSVEKSLYIVTADLAGANAVGFWKVR
jgi:patatin-like phospholipase/acyl hydrolase